jgi:hypothetical protein
MPSTEHDAAPSGFPPPGRARLITPELALVDPKLAAEARALLPEIDLDRPRAASPVRPPLPHRWSPQGGSPHRGALRPRSPLAGAAGVVLAAVALIGVVTLLNRRPSHAPVVAPRAPVSARPHAAGAAGESHARRNRLAPLPSAHARTVQRTAVRQPTVRQPTVRQPTVRQQTMHQTTVHQTTVRQASLGHNPPAAPDHARRTTPATPETTPATTTPASTAPAKTPPAATTPTRASTRVGPTIRWRSAPAGYFDFVLWYDGHRVLDRWPATPSITVPTAWSYHGARHELRPGVYLWFVYPGLGNRTSSRYGPLAASGRFVVR